MREHPHAKRPNAPQAGVPAATPDAAPRKRNADEMRIYGLNACLALFAKRPHDLRKVYLLESRLGDLKAVLAWCVQKKLGYRVVENQDLDKLTATQHHEGVCFEVRRRAPVSLSTLLQMVPRPPQPWRTRSRPASTGRRSSHAPRSSRTSVDERTRRRDAHGEHGKPQIMKARRVTMSEQVSKTIPQ